MIDWHEHISSDPNVCHGQACIKGTRVMVSVVLGNVTEGLSAEEIVREYPSITADDVQAALAYAADLQDVGPGPGDAFSGIESREGVCGGEPCIARTRIPVWVVQRMRQSGISETDILRSYPTITAQDLANAWHYARAHSAEIEAQAKANEQA